VVFPNGGFLANVVYTPRRKDLREWVTALLFAVLLLALVMMAANNVISAVRDVLGKDDSAYPESSLVERALALAHGEKLYGPTREWPYNAALYGPTTYGPVALAARVAGLEGSRHEQARRIYLIGRTVSFAAGLSIVLWLWLMAGRMGLRKGWRLLPVLLLLSSHHILLHWDTYRPDFPMVALILWAWWIALRADGGAVRIAAAALLMALAISYKHSAVLSAGILFLWFFVDRRRREAGGYAGALGILLACGAIWATWTTQGAFWDNTVGALRSPLRLLQLVSLLAMFNDLELIAFVGGLAACIGLVGRQPLLRPARWAFVLVFCTTQLLVIRVGSNVTYYLEAYCWGALLAGVFIHDSLTPNGSDQRLRVLRPHPAWIFLMCILLLLALGRIHIAVRQFAQLGRPLTSFERENPRLASILSSTRGEILLIDSSYGYWLSQSPPTIHDPFLYSVRVAANDLTSDPLVVKIAGHEFDKIVMSWDLRRPTPQKWQNFPPLPEPVVSAIVQNYHLAGMFGRFHLYLPGAQ